MGHVPAESPVNLKLTVTGELNCVPCGVKLTTGEILSPPSVAIPRVAGDEVSVVSTPIVVSLSKAFESEQDKQLVENGPLQSSHVLWHG